MFYEVSILQRIFLKIFKGGIYIFKNKFIELRPTIFIFMILFNFKSLEI